MSEQGTWVMSLLANSNPLIKYPTIALVAFGPLYILSSMGYKFPFFIAVIIFIGMLLRSIGAPILTTGKGPTFG